MCARVCVCVCVCETERDVISKSCFIFLCTTSLGQLVCVYVCCSAVSDCCDPMDCSPPGSSVHGTILARTLEWGAFSFSRVRAEGSAGG